MLVVFAIVAVVVVIAVAAAAVGRGGGLDPVDTTRIRPSLPDGPVSAADVAAVRFALDLLGYRKDQVHDVLGRLARELTDRDARISDLEGRLIARPPDRGRPG